MGKKRGRKRKDGSRTDAGQLSRAKPDRGNAVTAARFERFGTDGCDAIGRAYRARLLGDPDSAKALLDMARAMNRAYWAMLPGGADMRSGGGSAADDEAVMRRERWLTAQLTRVNRRGHANRVLFDELVIDFNPDFGPSWLDRLLDDSGNSGDRLRLASVIVTLRALAGIDEPHARAA